MDPATLLGVCALLVAGRPAPSLPAGVVCPSAKVQAAPVNVETLGLLTDALRAPSAREGIARVTFAEAGNQGDSGLAAVVYAILNRLTDGRWGLSVDNVLNARGQFEPVMRAGGEWRSLPPVSAAAQARIDTILNLALDGRLPDPTHGAQFFQNPAIVAQRARNGTVSARLVNFGGAAPSVVIGAHSFYVAPGRGGGSAGVRTQQGHSVAEDSLFVGENRAMSISASAGDALPTTVAPAQMGDPGRAMFVSRDGAISAYQP